MKKITGKYPEKNRESIGNSDCKLPSNLLGKYIVDIVADHVHAVRVEDNIVEIQRDTLYMDPNVSIKLDVVGEIKTTIDNTVPNIYESLIQHINSSYPDCCMEFLELSGIRNEGSVTRKAVCIRLNDKVAGYYMPEINSFLVGNWAWHDHYVTIIMKWIWPQIVAQLGLESCENSINAGRRAVSKPRLTVSIGADPEFEIIKNGIVVKADNTLNISNYTSKDIGLDGAGSQLEFRPKPGTPQQVVKNIRHLVQKLSVTYPDIDLTDEGDKYPLGGHIHVGIGHPIDISSDLVMILDDFIGRPTLNLSGKARKSYKFLGAVRTQPHGFEYRSTPSAVFQNPRITHIVCTLMKNLCEKYFNGETLEYHDIPTVEDYIKIGGLSKYQVKYFMDFCRDYKSQKSIRSSWKVSPANIHEVIPDIRPLHSPILEFRDEWYSEVESTIRNCIVEAIQTSFPITIVLYGLSRSRGENLCTIPLIDTNIITTDLPRRVWRENTLSIGFSYDMRNRGMHRSKVTNLVRSINALINSREQSQ